MDIKQFFVEGLGHGSYILVSDQAKEAAVVDPHRDIAVYADALDRANLRLRLVLETHTHNDYISGAKPLAERYKAEYVASADAGLQFPYRAVREGDRLWLGEVEIAVLATPGHTPEHVSYVVADTARAEAPLAVFTGGDLMVGGVGRVDLLGRELGERLAPRLYESLHDKLLCLEDFVEVYPTHGSGSLCGSSTGSKRTTTIGYERRYNPRLQLARDEFVRRALSGNPGIPTYYGRMRPINQRGPLPWQLPEAIALTEHRLAEFLREGAIVVDARSHLAFGAGHLPGSINVVLGASFATWVGWLLPEDVPLVLVLERPEAWVQAVTALARVGYDRVAGFVQPGSAAWTAVSEPAARVPQWRPDDLLKRMGERDLTVVDVRTDAEWEAGRLPGSIHLRLEDLEQRLHEIDRGKPVATLCRTGARSSTAASILLRAGFTQVANLHGGISACRASGLPVEVGARRAA
jgi:hydroxyacylglutathione hydrolase